MVYNIIAYLNRMKTYMWIVMVVLIVAVGAFIWNMSLPQPVAIPSPSVTATPVPTESTSIKVPTGEARFIADEHVAVGVQSVSVSFATVQISQNTPRALF